MKLDFIKNSKRNAVASLAQHGVNTIIPFFRKTIFMWVLGAEYLGLNGLFYSILGVLSLSELGFGNAIVCHMYKFVANDDRKKFCSYLYFYRFLYRCVGLFILVAGLCLLPFLRKLIHGNLPPGVNLHVLYLLFLANTVIGYFFFAYRGAILHAYHSDYIGTCIGIVSSMVEFAAAVLVIYFTRNYYFYLLVLIGRTIFSNLVTYIATRIHYPDIKPEGHLQKDEIRRIFKDVAAIFMHKIGGVINVHSDNLVISAFLGLVAIASYGNYVHVTGAVAGIVGILCSSMRGGFGNKVHTESREDNFRTLMKAHHLLMGLIIWSSAMLVALIQPFMVVWIRNRPELLCHFLTPLLLVLWFYEKQSRSSLLMFKSAAAIWQQDKWKAIVANVLNLALNITFIITFPDEYKLDGVILSTVISDVLIQIPWESYAVFSTFFGRTEARYYWKRQAVYLPLAIFVCAVTWTTAHFIPLAGIPGLLAKGCATAVVSTALLAPFFINDMKHMLLKLLGRQ